MQDEVNTVRLRNMFSKDAYQAMIRGFWVTRAANGLTTPEAAETHMQDQLVLLDSWYPDV